MYLFCLLLWGANISKVYLPFLMSGHKECDRLWKWNKNYSDSQNHRTAKVGRNLWRLSGAQSYSRLPRPVSSFHSRIWPLGYLYVEHTLAVDQRLHRKAPRLCHSLRPGKPRMSFHSVPQLSPSRQQNSLCKRWGQKMETSFSQLQGSAHYFSLPLPPGASVWIRFSWLLSFIKSAETKICPH